LSDIFIFEVHNFLSVLAKYSHQIDLVVYIGIAVIIGLGLRDGSEQTLCSGNIDELAGILLSASNILAVMP
jgi:hypothetical protein